MVKEEGGTQLIKDHQVLIYKIANLCAEQQEDQLDLYQEIVYHLWKAYDSFRSESKISTWMYQAALNTAIGQLKKGKTGWYVYLPIMSVFLFFFTRWRYGCYKNITIKEEKILEDLE